LKLKKGGRKITQGKTPVIPGGKKEKGKGHFAGTEGGGAQIKILITKTCSGRGTKIKEGIVPQDPKEREGSILT